MPLQQGDSARGRTSLLTRATCFVVITCALGALLALFTPSAHSQTSTPTPVPPPAAAPPLPPLGNPSAAPFPTAQTGLNGNGSPPLDVFYVSPQGTDAAPVVPNLACLATLPCKTIIFALSQARDGDAISLAGGTYPIPQQIEVNKLVTIAPNGFAPGSTTTSQISTTAFGSCGPLTALPQTVQCTTTLPVQVLAGSNLTFTVTAASGDQVSVTSFQPPLTPAGSPTGCSLSPTTPAPTPVGPAATVTFICPPGQTIPSGSILSFSVLVSTPVLPGVLTSPTVNLSITAPTTSIRPVLQSNAGTVFHVTAVGSSALHVTIFGLTIGNATSLNGSAAIVLDNDSFTEIAKNIIGAQDLPNAIGILLSASDHPSIHDNTIQGSTLFPRTATIAVGQATGGYGVVTAECLGSINHSNGVQLVNNLFAKNSNAGAWFCSDGTGGFFFSQNTLRANGRGIVLLDAVDTYISGNTIGDNVLDGIDVLQTSERNIITGNIIESQQAPQSAGILLAGNGAFTPLGNQITQNQIRRNTVDVLIVGAQGTRLTTNSITVVGSNTGVLLSLAIPGWSAGQPLNTMFGGNALQASGICSATAGCAIRLTAGVTVGIDATTLGGNDFGVSDPDAIQAQIWDNGRDPSLGTVYVLAPPPPPTPAPPILGLTPLPTAAPVVATPAVATAAPTTPPTTATPSPTSTPAATATHGASGPATVYLDPATGWYYVVLSLSVTDANGRSAANDTLTINFFAQDGTSLGSTTAMTDLHGAFSGNVQPGGSGRFSQPTRLVVTDATGANLPFTVTAGSPIVRPVVGPVQ